MRNVLVGLMIVGLCVSARAQGDPMFAACASKADDKERLACFDGAVKASKPGQANVGGAGTDEVVSSTKEIVAVPTTSGPPKSEAYRLIDPADLYVAPNKYLKRPIELRRMRCLHADKDEYRCIAPGSVIVTIFTARLTPSSEQAAVENECGEIRKMTTSPKCLKTIRFVPLKAEEDLVNGYTKRLVVVAAAVEIVQAASAKRR